MAKTQKELNALKKEVETLNNKLKELTDEELAQVTGGSSTVALGYQATGGAFIYRRQATEYDVS